MKENKTPFYARLETIVVQASEDKFSQIRTALTDITERKQAEEVLLEKEKELENQSQHLEKINTALKILLEVEPRPLLLVLSHQVPFRSHEALLHQIIHRLTQRPHISPGTQANHRHFVISSTALATAS